MKRSKALKSIGKAMMIISGVLLVFELIGKCNTASINQQYGYNVLSDYSAPYIIIEIVVFIFGLAFWSRGKDGAKDETKTSDSSDENYNANDSGETERIRDPHEFAYLHYLLINEFCKEVVPVLTSKFGSRTDPGANDNVRYVGLTLLYELLIQKYPDRAAQFIRSANLFSYSTENESELHAAELALGAMMDEIENVYYGTIPLHIGLPDLPKKGAWADDPLYRLSVWVIEHSNLDRVPIFDATLTTSVYSSISTWYSYAIEALADNEFVDDGTALNEHKTVRKCKKCGATVGALNIKCGQCGSTEFCITEE